MTLYVTFTIKGYPQVWEDPNCTVPSIEDFIVPPPPGRSYICGSGIYPKEFLSVEVATA